MKITSSTTLAEIGVKLGAIGVTSVNVRVQDGQTRIVLFADVNPGIFLARGRTIGEALAAAVDELEARIAAFTLMALPVDERAPRH